MARRIVIALSVVIFATGMAACGDSGTTGEDSVTQVEKKISPEKMGKIGAEIYRNPQQADSVFRKYDITEEQFNGNLRRISSDPDLAKLYRKSFESNR